MAIYDNALFSSNEDILFSSGEDELWSNYAIDDVFILTGEKKGVLSFQEFNDVQCENYIASNLPKGKFWDNIFDSNSNIYKLLNCLGTFVNIVTNQISTFVKNRSIDNIDVLMPEWQASVKWNVVLPEIASQRAQIKRLISKIPVYNINIFRTRAIPTVSMIETFVKTLTGIDIEITLENVVDETTRRQLVLIITPIVQSGVANNFFAIPFPVTFYNGSLTPEVLREIDLALNKVVPSYMAWYYQI
jgi:hypothetical protein